MHSGKLDTLPVEDLIGLMDTADARAMRAVRAARAELSLAAAAAARAMGRGGRLIYVGAGTSGRLGVLDASECPPTFSAKPGQVVGVMAGGARALRDAVEGAEDDAGAGAAEVKRLRVGAKDMVVGISASGAAPYVLGAIEEAGRRKADVWLITCNKKTRAPRGASAIVLDTGPEVIQGSTRLAAGTATKLALNRITTGAFVLMGKVYDDLMVDVMPTNDKLVRRAVGIIVKLAGCSDDEAARLLERSGGSAKVAVVMGAKGVGRREAERLLKKGGGFLREVIEG